MMSAEGPLGQGSQLRTVTIIGLSAVPVAIARYVMKGWVEPQFPTPERHALAHVAGFLPKLLLGLALGAVVYGIERRRRAGA
jgi:hypothetical protein